MSAQPRQIGRYVLWHELASGGMASVHLGRMLGPVGFGKTVAIKQMHSQFVKDEDFVGMFLDEARITSGLNHPNVVTSFDIVQEESNLFLVMEYVHGGAVSAAQRVLTRAKERVPPPIAVAIMAGALRGLHAAHEARTDDGSPLSIIHRDVSPQNILVSVDGIAKIGDFGIAKAAGQIHSTNEGVLKGKHAYMAPEQARGLPLTACADVFAAGIVLWELLAGQRLIVGASGMERLHALLNLDPKPPSTLGAGIPAALDEATLRALAPRPEDRFPTAGAMADAMERALAPATPSALSEWCRVTLADLLKVRDAALTEMRQWSMASGVRHESVRDLAAPASEPSAVRQASSPFIGQASAGGFGDPARVPDAIDVDDSATIKSETKAALTTTDLGGPSFHHGAARGGLGRPLVVAAAALGLVGFTLATFMTVLFMRGRAASSATASPPPASESPIEPATASSPPPIAESVATPAPAPPESAAAPNTTSASTTTTTTTTTTAAAKPRPSASAAARPQQQCRVVVTTGPAGRTQFKEVCGP